MALLTLKDIGKIYVSEGNVAVGIRGVNLSFDRGEFVAITGKSGSGKSTLLNVISGMDSYEEGEFYVEGQSTSHYLQPEWAEYREKYISFIFQDYNIIESFTVLQNVELALMHIEDAKERRARAMELITRVGLASHIKQKGSKLSGGQKQRTVIARALAKDSPIILADEPTGNLDSATSKEIIELLREVSRDKLLIVVTHNFEQVEDCATRHIRVFDGAVESDHVISRPAVSPVETPMTEPVPTRREKGRQPRQQIKNGITLGRHIFTAKPRLSVFLCFLMIVGTLGIFVMTSVCGSAADMFEPHYMFRHIDGRLVLATRSGEVLSEEEVRDIAETYGAESYLRFDALLDQGAYYSVDLPEVDDWRSIVVNCTYGEEFGDRIIGRYPEATNEVLLYLPISYQPTIGKEELAISTVRMSYMDLKVTGVKYYYDNNLVPKCLFTEEGFRTATAIHYLLLSENDITVQFRDDDGKTHDIILEQAIPSFDMPAGKIYIDSPSYDEMLKLGTVDGARYSTTVRFVTHYRKYNYYYEDSDREMTFERTFTEEDITSVNPTGAFASESSYVHRLILSDELIREMAETVLNDSYKQVSLFFANDRAAHLAAEKIQEAGYIAVPSDTTYEPDAWTVIMTVMSSVMMAVMWLLAIVFLAFFIHLCTSRSLGAFKGDMAIMRSMGIPVKVIRVGMYVRMLIALIPAFALTILTAILIFTSPKLNSYFVYLYAWQYALIFLGMLFLTVRVTHKQIRKLFGESVKKSLKGGDAA